VKDQMLIWEQYDDETWGAEWETLRRLALIKLTAPGEYTCLVGTLEEAEWSTVTATLSAGKALCQRFMILVNNCNPERVKVLSYKL